MTDPAKPPTAALPGPRTPSTRRWPAEPVELDRSANHRHGCPEECLPLHRTVDR